MAHQAFAGRRKSIRGCARRQNNAAPQSRPAGNKPRPFPYPLFLRNYRQIIYAAAPSRTLKLDRYTVNNRRLRCNFLPSSSSNRDSAKASPVTGIFFQGRSIIFNGFIPLAFLAPRLRRISLIKSRSASHPSLSASAIQVLMASAGPS